MKYRLKDTGLFYSDLKKSGHIISQELYRNSSVAFLNYYLLKGSSSIFIKSTERCIALYYIVSGMLDYRNSIQHSNVQQGYLNMIPANAINHELIFDEPCTVFLLFIPINVLLKYVETFPVVESLISRIDLPDQGTIMERDHLDDGRLALLIDKIIRIEKRNYESEKLLSGNVDAIILAALDYISAREPGAGGKYDLNRQDFASVVKIRSFLLERRSNMRPPALRALARMARMGEKKLEDCFKMAFQTTMFEFFHTARMEAIYRAFSDPELSLQQIADNFNYEDYSSFSAAVKKRYGKSPREIRKAMISLGHRSIN